ncbi:MAG TPA: TIGR03086 family metal-binding protein [Acidimicrobiales bacterium]|nr:TIGR03086 family metal-binding protein [Acidimicrobiales bacterium]
MEQLMKYSALLDDGTQMLSVLREAGVEFAGLVHEIPAEGWSMPTPCPEWDVLALVVHTASIIESLVPFANGNDLPPPIEPDELGASQHTSARIRIAVERGVAAWTPRSLREVRSFPWGVTRGLRAVEFTTVEVVAHGWDLAQALGVPFELADDVIAATRAVTRTYLDAATRAGLFDPPLDPGAGANGADALAAVLGRRPFTS